MRRAAVIGLAVAILATGGCRRAKGPAAGAAEGHVAPRIVRIYFEGPATLLASEERNVQMSDNPAAAAPILVRELLKGPVNPALVRALPADTVCRGTYLLPDGTAIVDLGGATLTAGWPTGSHEELMAVYSLAQTIGANLPQVKRVRILVNGTPGETLGGHIAIDRSITPNSAFLDPRSR